MLTAEEARSATRELVSAAAFASSSASVKQAAATVPAARLAEDFAAFQQIEPSGFKGLPDFDRQYSAWVLTSVFAVNLAAWEPDADGGHDAIMDLEILLTIAGPVCLHCGTPYTDAARGTRCVGELDV